MGANRRPAETPVRNHTETPSGLVSARGFGADANRFEHIRWAEQNEVPIPGKAVAPKTRRPEGATGPGGRDVRGRHQT